MRIISIIIFSIILTGCVSVPKYKDLKLDTTSNFRLPTKGMAGIYVYQWKSGIFGSAVDVEFEIKGQPVISLNTGEYGYMEISPGMYQYKAIGGLFKSYLSVEIEADQNYFFKASLVNARDSVGLVNWQQEIDEAKNNISSGRYEYYDVD